MSDQNTATRDNRGSNQNNRDQNRRRSRGGQNRNRQNRGGQQNRGSQQNRGGRQGGGNRNRRPKPKPLTWWQKLLKAVGLYKEPTPPQRDRSKRRDDDKKDAPKSNTRVAKPRRDKPERDKRDNRRERDTSERDTPEVVNTKRIYLGNLSYDATESDLEELFRGVGSVRRVEIVYNRKTHQSKGFGFVEMLDVDEAKRAIEILHDQYFMGRKITVSAAKSEGPVTPEPKSEEFRPANAAAAAPSASNQEAENAASSDEPDDDDKPAS